LIEKDVDVRYYDKRAQRLLKSNFYFNEEAVFKSYIRMVESKYFVVEVVSCLKISYRKFSI